MLLDDFSEGAERRWQYLSDRVMGGVSDGGAVLGEEGGTRFALLAGTVSTANNGGFIQLRRDLMTAQAAGSSGLQLTVRGTNGPYFIHIRTTDTRRPWHYYQASFPVSETWQDVTLPWSAFAAKGQRLPETIDPRIITSIGIVAYGRDHDAEVAVKKVILTED